MQIRYSRRHNLCSGPAAFFRTLILVSLVLATGRAQQPARPLPPAPGPEPQQKAPEPPLQSGYTIQSSVDLVVLHVSVTDEHGQFVPGLKEENFRVFEDDSEAKISVLRQEDAPVSMGLLIDNSGSMGDKREKVNAAALTFVKTSNPDDEVFVAHFNDKYHFDRDFTNDVNELKKALEQADPRSSTALYDATAASLDRLKSGYLDKKVLLIVSDGEDNSSHRSLEAALQEAQRSSALIYAVGLLREEKPESAERDRQALLALTRATGGWALFPENLEDVELTCIQISQDIRHQYTLAYYPTNTRKDGSFRSLRVQVSPASGSGTISARTRTGYFAQRVSSGN
ncbi:MAG: VWA domain-containing protein [Acidobacteria bacterium]|nr:MAG: VWA domain-containing protein [Acidobacteriota bacterium]